MAIFVSILDRSNLRHWDIEGPPIRYALELKVPSPEPWIDGVVYILDRTPFCQHGRNWVCAESVYPLGKLEVCPEDFPLLDQVERATLEENDTYLMIKDIVCELIEKERVTSRCTGSKSMRILALCVKLQIGDLFDIVKGNLSAMKSRLCQLAFAILKNLDVPAIEFIRWCDIPYSTVKSY